MSTPAIQHIAALDDDAIRALVAAADRLSRPLERRFEGDDTAVVELMATLGLSQHLVDKLLIVSLVYREAIHRGLRITHLDN